MPSRKSFSPACMEAERGDNMQFNGLEQQRQPRGSEEFHLEHLDSFIHNMGKILDELREAVRILPKVDQDGSSECSFAEDLYAEKDEFIEKIEKESKKIQPYLRLAEKEIARCRGNLDRINADAKSLNRDEAKERYASAKRAQESQYNKAIQQRKGLMDLISRTEKTLALARSKNFPGRKPRKVFRPPAGALGSWGATVSANEATGKVPAPNPQSNAEIDRLISLGPLGREEK